VWRRHRGAHARCGSDDRLRPATPGPDGGSTTPDAALATSAPARRSAAVAWTPAEMSKPLHGFQASVIHPGTRLPSAGSRRTRFARRQRYDARTKTARGPAPAFRSPSRAAAGASVGWLVSRIPAVPDRGDARCRAWPLVTRSAATPGFVTPRPQALPGFPLVPLPCSPSPPGRCRPASAGGPGRSPRLNRESPPEASSLSGLFLTASAPAAYASRFAHATRARLASGCLAGSTGRVSARACTRGFHSQLSVVQLPVTGHLLLRRPFPGALRP